MTKQCRTLLVALLILCVSNAATSAKTTAASPTPLEQALTYAPAATRSFAFTDWQRIKMIEKAITLNSATTALNERARWLLKTTVDRHAPMSGFGLAHFRTFAEMWGWDATDLAWEATLAAGDAPPLHVLQLRADFDMAALAERYKQRKFSATPLAEGITLYSAKLDSKADWVRGSELALVNTAIDAKRRRLIVSSGAAVIQAALAAKNDATAHANGPSVQRVARLLGTPAAGTLLMGPELCATVSVTFGKQLSKEQIEAIRKRLLNGKAVSPYETLSVSYDYVEGRPLGTIAMDYADAAKAKADLKARSDAAKNGISLAINKPYRDSVFALIDGSLQGSTLLLRVQPFRDRPGRLASMLLQRDMPFASCGE